LRRIEARGVVEQKLYSEDFKKFIPDLLVTESREWFEL
jgi:hypothetical protein